MTVLPSLWNARLYTFVDTAYLAGRAPSEVARQLCEGGSDLIQVRAKGAPAEEVRRIAESVLAVTRRAGVPLVLNDHWDLAIELGVEYAHLGQEDFFDAGMTHTDALRSGCGPGPFPRIGLSTHAPAQAERAMAAGPDYIAIGPVFPTATKPGRPAATLDYVRWAARSVQMPWFAIGGINFDTLDAVLEAGARRICVVSAILNAADPAKACRELRKRIEAAPLPPAPVTPV